MRVFLYSAQQNLSIKNRRMPRIFGFIRYFETSHTRTICHPCMCVKSDQIGKKSIKSYLYYIVSSVWAHCPAIISHYHLAGHGLGIFDHNCQALCKGAQNAPPHYCQILGKLVEHLFSAQEKSQPDPPHQATENIMREIPPYERSPYQRTARK